MYCSVSNKYRNSKKTEIKYIFLKILNLSVVYSKCGQEYERFRNGEAIEILRNLCLINNVQNYQKYILMPEENINQ